MPLLARSKQRVATQLGSAATAGDAAQSRLCAISAAAVLTTLVANWIPHWWWLDPITGLAIAAISIYEDAKPGKAMSAATANRSCWQRATL